MKGWRRICELGIIRFKFRFLNYMIYVLFILLCFILENLFMSVSIMGLSGSNFLKWNIYYMDYF